MSEHSDHYHDADRNKPLPGATVSSKEEVLQKLLDAARGEITALTEANKLLAAQVAVELRGVAYQVEQGAGFWHTCSGCHDTEDGHPMGKYAYSNEMRCALGNGCSECGGLGAIWDNNDYSEAVGDFLDIEVSARAADAPSEPSDIIALIEKAQKISQSMATRCYELTPLQVAWIIGKSRAADALDSQPKTGLLDKFIAEADAAGITHLNLAALDSQPTETQPGSPDFDGAEAFEAFQASGGYSSQPTDGEVHK